MEVKSKTWHIAGATRSFGSKVSTTGCKTATIQTVIKKQYGPIITRLACIQINNYTIKNPTKQYGVGKQVTNIYFSFFTYHHKA